MLEKVKSEEVVRSEEFRPVHLHIEQSMTKTEWGTHLELFLVDELGRRSTQEEVDTHFKNLTATGLWVVLKDPSRTPKRFPGFGKICSIDCDRRGCMIDDVHVLQSELHRYYQLD